MMKWTKLGQIFNPLEHQLYGNCKEFAQSPQTLVLNDRVRVFFSTREKDQTGKYLSHVAYADFDLSMQQLLGVSTHQIMPLGALGTFDEHGIFPIHLVNDGERVLAYTTGWNRKVSVSADAAIGLAISHNNGESFERYGAGPVMASSLLEPFLVADAFVLKQASGYHMWYIFGKEWKKFAENTEPDRIYKIAYAFSTDGINWQRDGVAIIPDLIDADECQALPTVIQVNGKYHMYFCYRHAFGFRTDSRRAYRLGYAWSLDGVNWTRDDENAGIGLSESGWDSEMQCYPHLFQAGGHIYLLYNGNAFGRYGFGLARLEQDQELNPKECHV